VIETHDQAVGELSLSSGTTLRVTTEHPFYLPERDAYVTAGELSAGARLLRWGGGQAAVTGALSFTAAQRETVYNITVAGPHNYFAGGVLVHNKSPPSFCDQYPHDCQCSGACRMNTQTTTQPACPLPDDRVLAGGEVPGRRLAGLIWDDADAGSEYPEVSVAAPAVDAVEMLEDPRAVDGIGAWFDRWLGIETPRDDSEPDPDPAVQALDDDLRRELRHFLRDRLASGTAADLLNATQTRMNDRVRAYYTGAEPPPAGEDSGWVQRMMEADRRGLLTLGALLRGHPSPSRRGRFIRERLLCEATQPHPDDVPFPEPFPLWTERQNLEFLVLDNPECADCHLPIDALGFGLVHFDAAGVFRTTDPVLGVPIVAGGVNSMGQSFDGSAELAEVIAADPRYPRCLVRSLLESAVRRPLTEADSCWITHFTRRLRDSGGSLRQLFLDIVGSPLFLSVPLE
jgi:hypothetical protein